MAFLELNRLSKHFGDFIAVDNFSLQIEQGEFVSLLGPSGCGKTTTLQMIAGLQLPTAGNISLKGQDLTEVAPNHRGLGIVFQSYALFPHMSVAANVAFGLEMRRVAREERKERVLRVLDQVRLSEFAERYPAELSGGQRQRVALARALVIEPPVLLLDEPLSNLDAKLREDMQLELRLLQQKLGVTTILVTHDQSEALSMSDRIVVMDAGRAVQIDTPLALYESPEDAFVSGFVGKTNLLKGTVLDSQHVQLGAATVAIDTGDREAGSTIYLSIRPEKIVLSEMPGALDAKIGAAVFHGSHWLYTLTSSVGDLIAVAPNSGMPPWPAGETVAVSWAETAPRVLPDDVRMDATQGVDSA